MMLGIITYHSAYNFGSALQAYATQQTLDILGYQTEIINYRMEEQNYYYKKLYRSKYGAKQFIKDLMQFPVHNERIERMAKFERFFTEYMHLSDEFAEPYDAKKMWDKYETVISGSDQIWNKHSFELKRNDWKYMNPYLLEGYSGRKVSYASSVANMTDDELSRIIPYVKKFDSIAMREGESAEKMSALLGRKIPSVLDPTFLLTKEDWIKALDLKKTDEEPYILYYSLGGPKNVSIHKNAIKKLAKKRGCRVKMVTPSALISYPEGNFENHPEYGPVDFLNAVMNAKAVISDSYHGTILSVNFGKDVFSVCRSGGSEFRKTDILKKIGLEDRICTPDDISGKEFDPIDYTAVYSKLDDLKGQSLDYLKNALEK